MEKLLYEASLEGNINILLMLLQEDPLILDRVTIDRHGDTPLHIASMLGHVDFVNEVITRKPHLAMERDSQKRVPLHIASAKGHVEIVKLLLSANPETCLARDRDGGNPVHLAAVKGHREVVKELVQAQPHAARAMVQQDTILHLCVKHNQPEVLKLLVETMDDHEFINTKDADGNTILHLAVADKQTINFLLLNTTIEVNVTNTNGETSMDILAQLHRDLFYQQIMQSLTRAGAVEANTRGSRRQVPRASRTNTGFDRILEYHTKPTSLIYLKEEQPEKEDWLNRKRSSLMVVASLIATMAFQAGTNPPSGVWQDDDSSHQAGFAIMAYKHVTLYHIFLVCNTVDFVSTFSIILLLISGLPFLKHKVFLWILMVIMWIATTSMSITYLVSILVTKPTPQSKTFKQVAGGIVLVWIGLMTLLVVGHTIRLIAVATRKFQNLVLPRKRTIISPVGNWA
ncbi:ankyrin repeat-containing protein NPR4 isoform X2 [Helianthus annuus]|uniref:ankyrin repeat-containing protein NPR4 isoform X2 n=1 Tax=Helianthus annuus TaxID=4232 RepID=UPI001652ED72|nr:ankyrin repeat-containing protein NPR4 isoform X2 [Helianthus annuus]